DLERGEGHMGAKKKLEASMVFQEAWERAKKLQGYLEKKERFLWSRSGIGKNKKMAK
ncbi:uncharacterized protein BDR25DRAFT_172403, partial [Lindgomyces ingoldianus]